MTKDLHSAVEDSILPHESKLLDICTEQTVIKAKSHVKDIAQDSVTVVQFQKMIR